MGGARKRLFPEREETWELGNGKGQSPPLPTHGFLSPPPPSANTWHGHKQGLWSLPPGQDWVKEAKNRQKKWGGGLMALPCGVARWAKELWPLGWAAGCSLPEQQTMDDRPLTRQCCPRVTGNWHDLFLKGSGGLPGLGGGQAECRGFPGTPGAQPSSPSSTLPPAPVFPANIVPITSENSRTKNKGSDGASSSQYHLPHSPKPAQEKLTPSCPKPFVTL